MLTTCVHWHRCNRTHLGLLCRSGPVIADAHATSPTIASVTLNPPVGSGPVTSYTLTLCPAAKNSCVSAICPAIDCLVRGLTPSTKYTVTAVALVAGEPLPASNSATCTTPGPVAPALTQAQPLSSKTAQLAADPPAQTAYDSVGFMQRLHCIRMPQTDPSILIPQRIPRAFDHTRVHAACLMQYTFTATPVNGGPAVTVTANSPTTTMTGLTPGAKVRPFYVT